MASSQAYERAERAAEYAAEQISESRGLPEEEEGAQKQGDAGRDAQRSVVEAAAGRAGRKAAELKESAAETGRKAREMLSDKKDEIMMKTTMAGDCPREILEDTEPAARKKMEDIWVRESGAGEENPAVEAAVRERAAQQAAAQRGVAAKENIVGAMGSVGGAIRNKLTMPSDIVAETRAARKHGSSGRATAAEEVEVNADNAPVGAMDSITQKAADVVRRVKDAATSN